ncbi:MAG TPA: methylmalonyl Co-A mutase-associated GTPase MeaB [Pseudogracilibacillus sp.]|nr:methylmalonyl Co-A mutase-associated GTPase MeaB [Pseudogracilibacillus sp.]
MKRGDHTGNDKANKLDEKLPGGKRRFIKKSRTVDVDSLYGGLRAGSRTSLARAITLIESVHPEDEAAAAKLLQHVLPHTGKSVRLGVSGVPGAGKSTFIETFGHMLCEAGHRVAVLAIDPSSTLSGGSILGDKTRMEKLTRHRRAFIRPSPSSGTLGGVHRKTRETISLCEAAGFDVIIVETVGVGQSETAVRDMVDFFMLLVLTGAGDDLQGMKKGIMEMVDLLIVHKADGDNVKRAKRTVREYKQLYHFLQQATPGWETKVKAVSSIDGTGHDEVWDIVQTFQAKMKESDVWEERRRRQQRTWFREMIIEQLYNHFFHDPEQKELVASLEKLVVSGELAVGEAVQRLFHRTKK